MPEPLDTTHGIDEVPDLERQTRELMARLGVVPKHIELTPEDAARTTAIAEAALAEMLARPPAAHRAKTRRAPFMLTRPRIIRMGAATATLVVAVIVVIAMQDWSRPGPAPGPVPVVQFDAARDAGVDVAAVLSGLAKAAGRQPDYAAAPVQLVVTEEWSAGSGGRPAGASPGTVGVVRKEKYLLPDNLIRVISHAGQGLDTTGRLPNAAMEDPAAITGDESVPGPAGGPAYPATLPLGPDDLIARLVSAHPSCTVLEQCLPAAFVELHETYAVPPALAAALWEALATSDNITYLGTATDRLGRRAVGFQVPGPAPGVVRIIFADTATGAYLGSEEVSTAGGGASGVDADTVLGFTYVAAVSRINLDQVAR